jgi:hypothetical protein
MYADIPSERSKEEVLEEFADLIFNHLKQIVPLLERWIKDIENATQIAERLAPLLNDPDPSVRKAAKNWGQVLNSEL